MTSIIPAIIYSIAYRHHFIPDLIGWQKFGLYFVFVLIYMILSFLSFISVIMNIASTIMFVGMIWALVDKLDSNILKVGTKVITAGFIGLLELAIFFNMTVKKK